MNRLPSSNRLLAGVALSLIAFDAQAADLPLKARPAVAVYDWTGFYLGGHFGYGGGSLGPGTNPLPEQAVFLPHSITGLTGGYQAGYQRQFGNRLVLGIEGDTTFTGAVDGAALHPAPFHASIDYTGTLRGRIGYAFGTFLPYATGGFAWGHTRTNIYDTAGTVLSSPGQYQIGWTAGAGVEFAVSGNWSAKVEYDYVALARRRYDLGAFGLPGADVTPDIHLLKVGLNYHLGDKAPWDKAPANAQTLLPDSADWNVHAQTTFIASGYPSFHSPYAGTDSLPGKGQIRETWSTTAFLGVRLWQGGEFYFNPELAQGFGFNGTLGLAGFPNGEALKAGGDYPKFRAQRYYLRQTIGFGGEQEDVADAANQLPGKRDIDRLTLIVGRFAVGDFFDGNAYAKDPRADFMNWAMWSSAAYDFPADLPGYTRGAVAEFNRKDWAVRAGLFEVPSVPSSDVLTFKTGGAVVEFEERHRLFDQPGKLRLGVFGNQVNTGNYREALDMVAADPALDINATMAGIRHIRPKYGFYANLEQQVATDVGLFARASWNDGHNEIASFTDIDRSVSAGLSVKGSFWGRPSDTVGLGGAVNGLSDAHRDFLAAGGLGLVIGDGRLNYAPERILESYYAYVIDKHFTFTADYQLVANPAYNADRGPVSIFSGRLHGEF